MLLRIFSAAGACQWPATRQAVPTSSRQHGNAQRRLDQIYDVDLIEAPTESKIIQVLPIRTDCRVPVRVSTLRCAAAGGSMPAKSKREHLCGVSGAKASRSAAQKHRSAARRSALKDRSAELRRPQCGAQKTAVRCEKDRTAVWRRPHCGREKIPSAWFLQPSLPTHGPSGVRSPMRPAAGCKRNPDAATLLPTHRHDAEARAPQPHDSSQDTFQPSTRMCVWAHVSKCGQQHAGHLSSTCKSSRRCPPPPPSLSLFGRGRLRCCSTGTNEQPRHHRGGYGDVQRRWSSRIMFFMKSKP